MPFINTILIFTIMIFVTIDLGLKFSRIYKTSLDFAPKYKALQNIKRIDLLKLNFQLILLSILFVFNSTLTYDSWKKDLNDPINLTFFIITLISMVIDVLTRLVFSYYTHVFVYEEGLLIENNLIPWNKCIVEKEDPSFITNGSVKISYETIEKKKFVTKTIKIPRDTDMSFMKNVTITNHKCF